MLTIYLVHIKWVRSHNSLWFRGTTPCLQQRPQDLMAQTNHQKERSDVTTYGRDLVLL